MREIGQEDCLLDVDDLSIEQLKEAFNKVTRSTDLIRQSLKMRCSQNRDDLFEGYLKILQEQ